MNRNYLTLINGFMKNLCLCFFIICTIKITAQVESINLNEQLENGKAYQLNLQNNESYQLAAYNNSGRLIYSGRRASPGNIHYDVFYGFADGTYYISNISYVNHNLFSYIGVDDVVTNNEKDAATYFKRTKIYDNDDDEEDARVKNIPALPNLSPASRSNNDEEFELVISHTNNGIILNEEYFIIINIPEGFEGNQITLFYNEFGKEIFQSPNRTRSDNTTYRNMLVFNNVEQSIYVPLKTKNPFQFSANNNETIVIEAIATVGDDEAEIDRATIELNFLGNAARAHDPNDILVEPACIDSRNIPDELEYTVRFQNIGAAPAINVLIDVDVPDAIDLDPNENYTFKLRRNGNQNSRLRPQEYEISNGKIKFKLMGFDLKGTNEAGVNEEETKAAINFKLPLKTNYNKQAITCQATILFEDGKEGQPCSSDITGCVGGKYPPLEKITTEPAITTYKKFHSLKPNKLKLGVDYILESNAPGLFAGITAAPGACKLGLYNQFELNFFYNRYTCNGGTIDTSQCAVYASENNNNSEIVEWEVESSTFSLGLVPLHLKYDLTNTASIGAGLEVRGAYKAGKFHQLGTGTSQRSDFLFDASLFADFNFVRNVTNYGIRYLYGYRFDFSDNGIDNQFANQSRAQIYFQYAF